MSRLRPVQCTEVVLRDGHQSLIATRLRTRDMLPICPQLDRVGYWSLEVWGGATFDACLRYLQEDPWERLRLLRQALPNTRLQMLLRGRNLLGYRPHGREVVDAFVERAAANGIDVFRIFDAMNDPRNLEDAIAAVRRLDRHAQGAICYTTSPVHTVEHFVALGRRLAELGCDSLVIKDMAGLLTPRATVELVTALREVVDLPLALHSHATSGLAALCQLKAVECGIDHIDTAISAFAGGTSHPATEAMVAALQHSDRDSGLDLDLLREIARYFHEVRRRYREFESDLTREDIGVHITQVPGGMMSNLGQQLRDQGALDRMEEVMAEIPRVRQELGYPPLVTPTSQIVGSQAVMNVLGTERYASVSNEVKNYLRGQYGSPPGTVCPEVRRLALGAAGDASNSDLADEPGLEALREQLGPLATSDEDVLTVALFPELGRRWLEEGREAAAGAAALATGEGESDPATVPAGLPARFVLDLAGNSHQVSIDGILDQGNGQRHYRLQIDGCDTEATVVLAEAEERSAGSAAVRPGASPVAAAMPGGVVELLVHQGEKVLAGQPLVVMEAMKMETELRAPHDGRIGTVWAHAGQRIAAGDLLLEVLPEQ